MMEKLAMNQDRRDFLRKVATGAAYAAPVIKTLCAPHTLLGQADNTTTDKGGMGEGMLMATISGVDPTLRQPGSNPAARPAPWEIAPPSGSTPSTNLPPTGSTGSGSVPPPGGGAP